MTPEHWKEIKEIIASAMERPPEERFAFLEQACGADPALKAEIRAMIEPSYTLTKLLPGDVVGGQYRIDRMLGKGGFGETYLAHDAKLQNRAVVVKVLHQAGPAVGIEADLHHEIDALAALDHPGVVVPLAAGRLDNGEPYLVMQFVDGCNLSGLIAEGGMALDRAGAILRQIGSALGAVHARNILHRDLKPANIMVQTLPGGDHIRLIDFGIARALAGSTATSVLTTPVGSPSYMAPEQFQGRSAKSSDIYAMAAVAYELVTGRRPDVSLLQRADKGAREEIRPRKLRPEIPEPAETLILQGLSADPALRPPDAASYGEALSETLTAAPEPAPPNKRWPALVLVCALAGGGATWVILHSGATHEPAASGKAAGARLEVGLRIERDGSIVRRSSAVRAQLSQGDALRFEIISSAPGHLYLLTENERAGAPLAVLFPSVTTNNNSSFAAGQKPILFPEKDPLGFAPDPDPDRVWVVWSPARIELLENASRWAQEPYAGVVGDKGEARELRKALASWTKLPSTGPGGIELLTGAGPAAFALEIDHR